MNSIRPTVLLRISANVIGSPVASYCIFILRFRPSASDAATLQKGQTLWRETKDDHGTSQQSRISVAFLSVAMAPGWWSDSSICCFQFLFLPTILPDERCPGPEKTTLIGGFVLFLSSASQQHERYERLLRRAKTEDLTEVSGIGCLYQSGVDKLGRPVVVFIGKWFNFHEIDLDKVRPRRPRRRRWCYFLFLLGWSLDWSIWIGETLVLFVQFVRFVESLINWIWTYCKI